jgi:2-polyprenyl-3-methyl-5-hydroxy-6-metoxy-1,4-benzoquinol methylase
MHHYPDNVQLESVACPSGCPRDDRKVLEGHDRIHGIPGRFNVVRCARCRLMRTDPRPTPQTIGVYYPSQYGPYHAPEAPPRTTTGVKARLIDLLGLNARRLPPRPAGRMIEIGCAGGAYMQAVQRAGWAVEGIEYSETAAQSARARGFHVQTASVESATDPSEPADVIAAWMVIEHLHDPAAALSKLRRWIKPDGYLIASVPDAGGSLLGLFGSYRYDLHLPNHLYHFTPRTLSPLLAAAGWRVERVFWQRNCNSLLWSAEYLCADKGWPRLAAALRTLRESDRYGRARVALSCLLGFTRQSGRIEVWARPVTTQAPRR